MVPRLSNAPELPSGLTRKQAEILAREQRILQLARPMVTDGGLAGISMDAIAKEMDYAKGTIYNHFSCKEEILLALAIEANSKRLELFQAAADRQEDSRDKMASIGVACEDFRERFADLFQIDVMVRHAAVWEKASEKRRELMAQCEQRCMAKVASVGHQAIASGDLDLGGSTRVEDMMFGLWSLTYGGMIIDDSSPGLDHVGIRSAFTAIRRNCHALMDGYGWQPLYDPERDRKLVRSTRAYLRRHVHDDTSIPATTGKDH
ncbi:MAG: TetR/AcrR family transcriptional regulator [Planctomycetota bacterium]